MQQNKPIRLYVENYTYLKLYDESLKCLNWEQAPRLYQTNTKLEKRVDISLKKASRCKIGEMYDLISKAIGGKLVNMKGNL